MKVCKIILCIILPLILGFLIGIGCGKLCDRFEEKVQVQVQEEQPIEENAAVAVVEQEPDPVDFEPITMYTTTRVNMRTAPNLESQVVKVLPTNTEIVKINNVDDEWSVITYQDDINHYYIATQYISTEKVKIVEKPKQVTTRNAAPRGGSVLTKSKGVNYFNGHKETWYSQKVLPGNGLQIPGRHVAADGTIRDVNDYICVASSDYRMGTIIETSLGTGKVYDSGCASGVVDIYTNW